MVKPSAANRLANRLSDAVSARVSEGSAYLAPLLTFVEFAPSRDGHLVVRMPRDLAAFDEIWGIAQSEAHLLHVNVSRKDRWPNADELRELLGAIDWLWVRWIPVGFLTLLVGEPGSGKSFLLLDWMRRVLLGEHWPLEVNPLSAGRQLPACTIWVEAESSQQLVTSRSQTMGIPGARLYMPGFGEDLLGQPNMDSEADRQRIINAVKDLKPALVGLDSLGGARSGGENKIEEVRPMLDFLAQLARDEKVPVVAVHHLRKRVAGESIEVSMDRVRGSSAFSAFARSIVAVEGNLISQNIRVIKANLCAKPAPIAFKILFDKKENPTGVDYSPWQPPKRKLAKKEICAGWVVSELQKAKGNSLPLKELVNLGEPQGFARGMIYAAKDVLDGGIVASGTGNSARWSLAAQEINLDVLTQLEEE